MKRPSYRELDRKLKEAKEASLRGRIQFVESVSINADLLEIDVLIDDLVEILPEAIGEIEPEKYQGARPPQKSYEAAIFKCELFPFAWPSRVFGCTMYLKFALKDELIWIVSLHRDRK